MFRRDFLKTCAAAAFTVAGTQFFINDLQAGEFKYAPYKKALLTKADGSPLRIKDIVNDVPYIFNYPFASTPVFLLNLDLPVKEKELKTNTGESYTAPAGIGAGRTIVAYCAICQHQLMYPTKDYTVINFYDKKAEKCTSGVQLIKCCAHNSIYDPKANGSVLSGPADSPLAQIVLEYDAIKDEIYAVGVAGKQPFMEFFDMYKKELRADYGSSANAKAEVEKAKVVKLSEYSASVIQC